MEWIGYWNGWRRDRYFAYEVKIEDGVFKVECQFNKRGYNFGHEDELDFKRAFGVRFFGDSEFLIGVYNDYVTNFLFRCNGKSEDEVMRICADHRKAREAKRAEVAEKREKWSELREKFDGVVIGVDGKIDVYGNGFSVRVLFSSDVTFEGRKRFLSENKVEFVRWVMHEIGQSKAMARRIGDMRYYRPVEIINLRAHEVEVKFEVKEVA